MQVLKVSVSNLATFYMLYKDINLINTEIDIYRKVSHQKRLELLQKNT
jgi:hypothetical protein